MTGVGFFLAYLALSIRLFLGTVANAFLPEIEKPINNFFQQWRCSMQLEVVPISPPTNVGPKRTMSASPRSMTASQTSPPVAPPAAPQKSSPVMLPGDPTDLHTKFRNHISFCRREKCRLLNEWTDRRLYFTLTLPLPPLVLVWNK